MAGLFDKIFGRHEEASWMYDLELFQDTSEKAYLKQAALNTCIEFLARTLSQSEFRFLDADNKSLKDQSWYKLNVRPNTDLSSTDFWQKVIYKLIYDNEVLIVVTDTKDLVVADNYNRKKYALYPDIFEDVTVSDYEFERSFNMDEVIYLTYNNDKLNKFTEGLFADYGEIFGRMISAQMRNYQIRGIMNVDSSAVNGEKNTEKMQNYVDKVVNSFSNNGVAVAPLTKGFDYQDVSSASKSNNAPFDELGKLFRSLIDIVAKAIGIPPSLIHGEMADLDNAMKSYIKFCIKPLIKKIEDELNAKLLKQNEVIKGKRIKVIGIDKKDPLEMAESIDKLVSSSTFTPNQVLVMLGEEPSDDPQMDQYFVTKNYTTTREETADSTPEGGETDED
ncbi:phage portal protein [Staphylococcus carnosus]|uniref:Phage portal protein n=1 Tax=Staphylococcus carnosus (strain TM300) TaxID=396513 RepID=B9DJD6_STACT|nr:phage portal protein [Staphylococcus carnosus]UTB78850.1 phage portal protein [Staphylococcus carnosus]UTB88403.1 phage portal protein [Staphylococcus carnosus]UTB90751.1 phage portal protein [Staphylococcus carnosus]CAL27408.1 putative phage portal protein [Staphylococcus carnosus subsp. carnosus TM300]SUL91166.1 putative phage portal protein [Staphylococcus carnosus]